MLKIYFLTCATFSLFHPQRKKTLKSAPICDYSLGTKVYEYIQNPINEASKIIVKTIHLSKALPGSLLAEY